VTILFILYLQGRQWNSIRGVGLDVWLGSVCRQYLMFLLQNGKCSIIEVHIQCLIKTVYHDTYIYALRGLCSGAVYFLSN
jgi:hypothetical protein